MATSSGIQGQILEITVIGCNRLRDTEWISRQDPYVCLEYASTKFRTRTCTDGGKNPNFNEKFVFTLIEGLRELNVHVWNSNTVSSDDFIGSGKILLQKVLSQGFDDSTWPIQTRSGRYGGEVRLIMHYSGTQKPGKFAAAAPSPYPFAAYAPSALYPAAPYPPYGQMPPSGYPPSPYPSYHPYPAPPTTYPPASYPPQPSVYPPPAYAPQTYPPGPPSYPYPAGPPACPGIYPPPPTY